MMTVIIARHLTMLALTLVMSFTLAGSGPEPGGAGSGQQGTAASPKSASTSKSTAVEQGWVSLFNGRDLDGWYTFLQKHGKNQDPDHVITIEDGSIHLYKHAREGSNVVMGYIATEKEYGDYHLRLQYRWGTKKFQPRYHLKRDAGLYYHIIGPDAVWPTALQFQIQQTDAGDLAAQYGLTLDTWIDPKSREDAQSTYLDPKQGGQARVLGGRGIGYQKRRPGDLELPGWNTVEVIAHGDTTVHLLNGHVVNQGQKIRYRDPKTDGTTTRPITQGRIALEIEAAEIYFRNVEIRINH